MGVLAVAVSVILVVGGVLRAALVAAAVAVGVPAGVTVGPACAGWGGDSAVAVGSPRRSVDGVPQAGVVELRYRSGSQWEVRTVTSAMLGLPSEANG